MIQIQHLKVNYQNQPAFTLRIDQLQIHAGECILLCGRSGSGKSSFLRILNGLIPEYYEANYEGKCLLAGKSIWEQSIAELSLMVGSVFQNPARQFFHQEVLAELVFPCENQGITRDEIDRRLSQVTELLSLAPLLPRRMLDLSGGERQKIAIATALMQNPKLLLLDEPSANLDETGLRELTRCIRRIKEAGITILISEHRLYYLRDLADSYLYFEDGHLRWQWSAADFATLSHEKRQSLGLRSRQKSPLPCNHCIEGNMATRENGMTLDHLVIGRGSFAKELPPLFFPAASITGIIGANGVGKSTLLETIAGLLGPKQGQILWNGSALRPKNRIVKSALVMQDVHLQLVTPSVREEIALGGADISEEIYTPLGLLPFLEQHPLSLSGGQQQRVMIANALGLHKSFYLFDEPTSGLDYSQMIQVSRLLQSLIRPDALVLVVSHDEEFLNEVCDQVLLLD